MWKSLLFLCLFVVGGALGAATREKIAVASDNRAKLSENEIQALTSRIEAKLNGKFNVVTRSALEAILRENQFQTESGLVDDRGTLARFGKVSGVNLLLHYTVAKLGNKYTMSFMLVNCTTGEVDAEKKAVVDAVSFAQLIARMEIALDKMGLLAKGADAVRKLAILPVKVAGRNISPADAAAFGSKLGSSLRGSGAFELLERADLDKIVAESGMVDFELADSGQYSRIAQMSVADDILVLNLTRLENNLISSSTQIAGTNSRIVSTVQANFKLLEVKTGKVIASGDFKFTMRSTEIPASEKRDWTAADYTNALRCRFDRNHSGAGRSGARRRSGRRAGLSDTRLPRRRKDGRCFPGLCQERGDRASCDEKSDRAGGKDGGNGPCEFRSAGVEHCVDRDRESR